jgi:hypothetical protein
MTFPKQKPLPNLLMNPENALNSQKCIEPNEFGQLQTLA